MGVDSDKKDMETRLEWMDRAGVKAQVLAVTPQSPALPEAEHAAYAARMINERYMISLTPTRAVSITTPPFLSHTSTRR